MGVTVDRHTHADRLVHAVGLRPAKLQRLLELLLKPQLRLDHLLDRRLAPHDRRMDDRGKELPRCLGASALAQMDQVVRQADEFTLAIGRRRDQQSRGLSTTTVVLNERRALHESRA